MATISDNDILGFYASFNFDDKDQELVNTYLWGPAGLKAQLGLLKWQDYGQDFHLILFEFYVKPVPYLSKALKEIGSYRRKERSIGISVILDDLNFFHLSEIGQRKFLRSTIINRLEMLNKKVKSNKLDLKLDKLKADVEKAFENSDQVNNI